MLTCTVRIGRISAMERLLRHEKTAGLLHLARTLASSAEGLTLDEMATELAADRRTAERMRDAIRSVFPQMEADRA